ncbi:MAG: iron-sulfur cluster assembly scaffold protein [Candidatus Babeliales bacterium]
MRPMLNLYREILMDHYRHPRNKGRLSEPSFSSAEHNPSCGDSVLFDGKVVDDVLTQVSFEGKGCVISQATASLLTQTVQGKKLEEILGLDKEAVLALVGMDLGPTRLGCALLPLQALQQGVRMYQKEQYA